MSRIWTVARRIRGHEAGVAGRRTAGVLRAGAAAVAGRGVGLLVSALSVPLTTRYLGPERYGVWIVLSTLLAWLQLTDFGLGNTVTTAVAEAHGADDRATIRRHVGTATVLLTVTGLLVAAGGAAVASLVPWAEWLRIQDPAAAAELTPAFRRAVLLFAAGLPLGLASRVLFGLQQGASSNLWSAAGNLASLGGLVVATQLRGGLSALVVGTYGVQVAVQGLSLVWLVGRRAPWLRGASRSVDRRAARHLLRGGGLFLIVQAAALVTYQIDNLVVARVLGVAAVAPYSVAYRLFSYLAVTHTLFFTPLWAAFAEAKARDDWAWIRRIHQRYLWGATLGTAVLAVPLVFAGPALIRVWGGEAVVPSVALCAWMGAWAVLLAVLNVTACVLNGLGDLRGQAVYGTLAAAVNIPLSVVLAQQFGGSGVIASTVLTVGLLNGAPLVYALSRRLRRR